MEQIVSHGERSVNYVNGCNVFSMTNLVGESGLSAS